MKYIFFLFYIILILFSPLSVSAANSNSQFITIVNPVRVSRYTKDLSSNIRAQYQEIKDRDLPATWLLTYDVLENSSVTAELTNLDLQQEIGIFLEVSSDFASKADVKYNKTDSWHRAHALFLSGYKQQDRIKLIDTIFDRFQEIFGYYPSSVGAWWIDSYSLDYMQKKYNIVANLGLADQFATDGYQVWGQFWSSPFIPNKYHAGIPASKLSNKLNLVTIEWAPRDPLNGYGINPANNYSTQDFLTLNLSYDYFSKLLDVYTLKNLNEFAQITIGLEGDLDPSAYHSSYAKQLDVTKTKNVKFLTMTNFAKWYLSNYQLTPPQAIVTNDLLGTPKKVIWYQSSHYRIGLSHDYETNQTEIFDFRIYPEDFMEPNYLSPNEQLNLYINLPSIIDKTSNTNSKWLISNNKLTNLVKRDNDLTISFGDQEIKFTSNNIFLHNINNLPNYFRRSPLLKVSSWLSDTKITTQTKYIFPPEGLIFRGLSIESYYFMKRPKIQLFAKVATVSIILALSLLLYLRINKRLKFIILSTFLCTLVFAGGTLYFANSQIFEVSQSEIDALLNLASLPYGKVIVYDGGCLICTWHTKYPPPVYANNRSYLQSISKKPIVYNSKIFNAETIQEGRKELKKTFAKYIYVTKFEGYKEVVPFSPGDYSLDLVFENSNAQIWKIKDNAIF